MSIDEFVSLGTAEEQRQVELDMLIWSLICDERIAMLSGAMDGEFMEELNPAYCNDNNLYYQDYLVMAQILENNTNYLIFFNN